MTCHLVQVTNLGTVLPWTSSDLVGTSHTSLDGGGLVFVPTNNKTSGVLDGGTREGHEALKSEKSEKLGIKVRKDGGKLAIGQIV